MCVNWFTTGVIASWWSPLLFSWAISCFVTKVETSGIWVVLEFGELLCPFLGDTILVTILVDLLILELDWESTWRFEVWARRFLSRFLVFCGGKNWIVNLVFKMGEITFIPSFIYSLSIQGVLGSFRFHCCGFHSCGISISQSHYICKSCVGRCLQ